MILSHRCTCGHPDFFHTNFLGECSHGWCRQKCREADLHYEPELLPTFTDNREVIEELIPPGAVWGVKGLTACACVRCQELAKEMNA